MALEVPVHELISCCKSYDLQQTPQRAPEFRCAISITIFVALSELYSTFFQGMLSVSSTSNLALIETLSSLYSTEISVRVSIDDLSFDFLFF